MRTYANIYVTLLSLSLSRPSITTLQSRETTTSYNPLITPFTAAALLVKLASNPRLWIFITGGCSRRRVQWMGVVSYCKLVYNTIQITTPCFHCTPRC